MEGLKDLKDIPLGIATDAELERLKAMSDDDVLRAAGTLDAFAIVLASLRLRHALQKEEAVIKRLTWWLVFFTAILVVFGLVQELRGL